MMRVCKNVALVVQFVRYLLRTCPEPTPAAQLTLVAAVEIVEMTWLTEAPRLTTHIANPRNA